MKAVRCGLRLVRKLHLPLFQHKKTETFPTQKSECAIFFLCEYVAELANGAGDEANLVEGLRVPRAVCMSTFIYADTNTKNRLCTFLFINRNK